jgi:hypothetical protein
VQAVIRPDGLPIWVSDVAPGHLHDLTVARDAGVGLDHSPGVKVDVSVHPW